MFNIALIDDDRAGLDSIIYCLESDLKDKANIHGFSSGLDFLENMRKTEFHLIISDLEMPDISGIELIQKVKTYKQSIPIVVLTGNTNLLRHNLEVRKYIFEVLIKPVEYRQLLRTIKDGLACVDFLFTAQESDSSLDDPAADKRITNELLQITGELRSTLSSGNYDRHHLISLLDSQEKLLRVLRERSNL